jgi:tetratricopeptide (TPR) repeat protein
MNVFGDPKNKYYSRVLSGGARSRHLCCVYFCCNSMKPFNLFLTFLSIAVIAAAGYAFNRRYTPGETVTPSAPTPSEQPETPQQDVKKIVEDLIKKGDEAYLAKQYQEGLGFYRQATEKDSGNAAAWLKRGNSERETGEAEAALSSYGHARAADPKLGDAYLNAAAILWGEDKKEEAKTLLREGIRADASRKADLQTTLDVYEAIS